MLAPVAASIQCDTGDASGLSATRATSPIPVNRRPSAHTLTMSSPRIHTDRKEDQGSRRTQSSAARRGREAVARRREGIPLMELLPPVGGADVAPRHDLHELERRIDL